MFAGCIGDIGPPRRVRAALAQGYNTSRISTQRVMRTRVGSVSRLLVAVALFAMSATVGAFVTVGPRRAMQHSLRPMTGIKTVSAATKATNEGSARPPLPADYFKESLLDKVLLQLFRGLVQKEIGFVSSKQGYDGLIDEARYYQMKPGVTKEDQQQMVLNVLNSIAGPALPLVYRTFMAPFFWSPFLTALFTPPIFGFLVGPNQLDQREDGKPGGIYVHRCRFLEETDCKGLCVHMCKLPTERFFHDTLGMDMTMTPDLNTYECRLSYGMTPPDWMEDTRIPEGCTPGCDGVRTIEEGKADRCTVCGK